MRWLIARVPCHFELCMVSLWLQPNRRASTRYSAARCWIRWMWRIVFFVVVVDSRKMQLAIGGVHHVTQSRPLLVARNMNVKACSPVRQDVPAANATCFRCHKSHFISGNKNKFFEWREWGAARAAATGDDDAIPLCLHINRLKWHVQLVLRKWLHRRWMRDHTAPAHWQAFVLSAISDESEYAKNGKCEFHESAHAITNRFFCVLIPLFVSGVLRSVCDCLFCFSDKIVEDTEGRGEPCLSEVCHFRTFILSGFCVSGKCRPIRERRTQRRFPPKFSVCRCRMSRAKKQW